MDKTLTVLGEHLFWHPHRALCISPHFVRWGEIYPIFGPRLNFFGAALTISIPIPFGGVILGHFAVFRGSRCHSQLFEKPRKTSIQLLVAPTGFEPVFQPRQ